MNNSKYVSNCFRKHKSMRLSENGLPILQCIFIPIDGEVVSFYIRGSYSEENGIKMISISITPFQAKHKNRYESFHFGTNATGESLDKMIDELCNKMMTHLINISDLENEYKRYCGLLNKKYIYKVFVWGLLDIADELSDPYELYTDNDQKRTIKRYFDDANERFISIIKSIHREKKSIKNLWGLLS